MNRLSFGDFVDKSFWALLLAVISYGVISVNKLNENIAVIVQQVSTHEKRLDKHADKIDFLMQKSHVQDLK